MSCPPTSIGLITVPQSSTPPMSPADPDRARLRVDLDDGGNAPVGAGRVRIMEPGAGEVRLGLGLTGTDIAKGGLRDLPHERQVG